MRQLSKRGSLTVFQRVLWNETSPAYSIIVVVSLSVFLANSSLSFYRKTSVTSWYGDLDRIIRITYVKRIQKNCKRKKKKRYTGCLKINFQTSNHMPPEKGKSKYSLCLQCLGASDTSGIFRGNVRVKKYGLQIIQEK